MNTALGWPLCDIGAAHPMTITQSPHPSTMPGSNPWAGEKVRGGVCRTGQQGQHGTFRGTLITGDKEGDDVVVGTFTITQGGKQGGGRRHEDQGHFRRQVRLQWFGSGRHDGAQSEVDTEPAALDSPAAMQEVKYANSSCLASGGSFVLKSTIKVTNPTRPS